MVLISLNDEILKSSPPECFILLELSATGSNAYHSPKSLIHSHCFEVDDHLCWSHVMRHVFLNHNYVSYDIHLYSWLVLSELWYPSVFFACTIIRMTRWNTPYRYLFKMIHVQLIVLIWKFSVLTLARACNHTTPSSLALQVSSIQSNSAEWP